ALLSWRSRIVLSSLSVLLGLAVYSGLSIALFAQYRYWLPLVLPVLGAFMTHFCMVTIAGLSRTRNGGASDRSSPSWFHRTSSTNCSKPRTFRSAARGAR